MEWVALIVTGGAAVPLGVVALVRLLVDRADGPQAKQHAAEYLRALRERNAAAVEARAGVVRTRERVGAR